MPGVGLAPGGAVAAEDVRNLKRGTMAKAITPWARSCRRYRALRYFERASFFFSIRQSRSKGLITLRIVLVATRV